MIVMLLYSHIIILFMQELISKLSIRVNSHIYLKDPETSDLGKRIVDGGIDLIDEIGFEAFTFRKLGQHIKSPEASIYRYFESKHKLLLYLMSWYWGWMEYRMVLGLTNIKSPQERLNIAITMLTEQVSQDSNFSHIDEVKLNRIVISESSKSYLTKDVDHENKEGVFSGYKSLVARVSDIVEEINPNYKYRHMLVSTVIEGAHHQRYFVEHLPKLTDVVKGEDAIVTFSLQIMINAVQGNE